MARRTTLFVGLALALHVIAIVLLPVARFPLPRERPQELTWLDVQEEATVRVAVAEGTLLSPNAVERASPRAATFTTSARETLNNVVQPELTTMASAATSSEPPPTTLFRTRASIGLDGPGSYRIDVARQQPDESTRAQDDLHHAIMDPIHEHERLNGTLAAGPIVAELETSTRQLPGSPFEGRAIFAIRIDELGLVVSAQVDESSGDRLAWDEVAKYMFNAFAQKRVRLPPGAKGIAMRVEITSKVVLPSGARHPITAQLGGPPDPTMPTLPIVSGAFDLSDIGAHPVRVVGARVLSENAF